MKRLFTYLFILIIMTSQTVKSQNRQIGDKELEKIRSSFVKDSNSKAIQNALSNNSVKNLALNRDNLNKFDFHFKYKVDVVGITDQKSSGRCWMFTGLNVLRPKVIEKYKLANFEFSTNYLYFWDIFEKSNLFLEEVIATGENNMDDKKVDWLFSSVVGDGGVWNSLVNLVEKYGLVPKSIMPETKNSENTSWMLRMIRRKLREDALQLREMIEKKSKHSEIQTKKIEILCDIYRMLALNLGEPPTEFDYRFVDKDGNILVNKSYTALSFRDEVLPELDFDKYVMLMNDPTREYYKLYEIDLDRNIVEGKNWLYINLPADDLKKYALESIKNNEAMYASCDVGKQLNKENGLLDVNNYDFESLYGVSFGMNKKQRILAHESGSTHGMSLVAVDVDKNENPVKWQFENSWGETAGHNGYLIFSDKWFDEYMFRVVVLEEFIDEKTLKILNQKPVLLPPWDPMFSEDL